MWVSAGVLLARVSRCLGLHLPFQGDGQLLHWVTHRRRSHRPGSLWRSWPWHLLMDQALPSFTPQSLFQGVVGACRGGPALEGSSAARTLGGGEGGLMRAQIPSSALPSALCGPWAGAWPPLACLVFCMHSKEQTGNSGSQQPPF